MHNGPLSHFPTLHLVSSSGVWLSGWKFAVSAPCATNPSVGSSRTLHRELKDPRTPWRCNRKETLLVTDKQAFHMCFKITTGDDCLYVPEKLPRPQITRFVLHRWGGGDGYRVHGHSSLEKYRMIHLKREKNLNI